MAGIFRAVVLRLLLICTALLSQWADASDEFENRIRPLLARHCVGCHGAQKSEGGLRLDRREFLVNGGDRGSVISTEDPAGSLLLKALRHTDDLQMPPSGRLSDVEIQAVERWMASGASWPDGVVVDSGRAALRSGPVTDAERQFWAFQPIRVSEVPPDVTADVSEIDRFLNANLREAGLTPNPPTDRRTWIRRATYDLTGLPPDIEDVRRFLEDESADAEASVIERLLQSSAYGERWGRHWLDLVRYADTAGETADYPTPLSYRYRNWVIEAFNRDMAYDEFVRQQLAGDLLADELAESASDEERSRHEFRDRCRDMRTATGFIAVSRRFGFDVENYHHLTIQDTIDVTGQSVLGLTLGCARCHDHKYDPVSMEDYYAWYGIFDSTRYSFPGSEEKKRPYDLFSSLPDVLTKDEQNPSTEQIYGATDRDSATNASVQLRGEPSQKGDVVPRRNLQLLGGQPVPDTAGSGRLQLASWLTSDENPLFARVMVNRIWQQHFGRGLVGTENDFGVRGERPSHPELLDWLAFHFRKSGYSVKQMHRLIMKTDAYRRSSTFQPTAAEADPENRLHWRFSSRRLNADELRDSLLAISGQLDRSMGAEHPFPPVDSWGFTQHTPFYAVYPTNRRSVYLMQQRLKRHPFLGLFDGADTNVSTARRDLTTVPTQALFLMNSEFVHQQSEFFARKLVESTNDERQRIASAFEQTLVRPPWEDELHECLEFLTQSREAAQAEGISDDRIPLLALSSLCRSLLTRNEFLFLD
ncbi:MAG: DUF1553 domain-containing protein [Planctomycetaceae bacterium]